MSVSCQFINPSQIIMLGLPAHTTHLLQPLDVGIFNHIKTKYNSLCVASGARSARTRITKQHFPTVWSHACKAATKEVVMSAFKRSGICPFDPTAIDDSQLRKRPLVINYIDDIISCINQPSILLCGTIVTFNA